MWNTVGSVVSRGAGSGRVGDWPRRAVGATRARTKRARPIREYIFPISYSNSSCQKRVDGRARSLDPRCEGGEGLGPRASAGARDSIQRRPMGRHRLSKRVGEASEVSALPEVADAICTSPAELSESRASGGILIGVRVRRIENGEIDVAGVWNLGNPGDVTVANEHLPISSARLIDGDHLGVRQQR